MPKTFDSIKDISELEEKVVLVTGGNAGLGAATVRAIAAHNPSCIYLCARRRSAAEEAVTSIHAEHPKANIQILGLDLNSFDSVKTCAAEFNQLSSRLDILFLNAGVSATLAGLTNEGYENQFGINHMGHALFTQLLMPKMLQTVHQNPKTADVRIVVVSSRGGHGFVPKTGLALDQMKTTAESWNGMVRYGHSKLANILFAKKLAQLYPQITSTSLHPGTVKSDIWGKADGMKLMSYLLAPVVWAVGVTNDEGAKTQLWCATAATGTGEGKVENGIFYMPIGKKKEDNANASNPKLRDELWQWTNDELAEHGAPGWPEL